CCSPTLTPSAGRARKEARRRGAAEAGARPTPVKASATTAAIPRSTSAIKRSWASAAFADPIRFRARLLGPATPGQVSARACGAFAAGDVAPLGLRYRVSPLLALGAILELQRTPHIQSGPGGGLGVP